MDDQNDLAVAGSATRRFPHRLDRPFREHDQPRRQRIPPVLQLERRVDRERVRDPAGRMHVERFDPEVCSADDGDFVVVYECRRRG